MYKNVGHAVFCFKTNKDISKFVSEIQEIVKV